MAFFKFRKSGDEPAPAPVHPESIEMMRQRAKYRLAGAAVLVLIGVIGLPILFDKQPRPMAIDTPIEIPDKNKAIKLTIPAPVAIAPVARETAVPPAPDAIEPKPAAAVPDASAAVPKAGTPTEPTSAPSVASATTDVPTAKVVAIKPVPASSKPTKAMTKKLPTNAAPKVTPAVVTQTDDGSKAQALLDGDNPDNPATPAATRFIVQIGAFADAARAQEVRLKVEHAGLKTYTHIASTKEGPRTRVRVGPFATKHEADKASERIKKLALPAVILKL